MSDSKRFEEFVNIQIKRINEYSLWEKCFNNFLTKKITRKNQQFNILDKEWIEKWKEYVGYEQIKDKCNLFCEKESAVLKKEISDFLSNNNSKDKLEKLGQLDCSKIKKEKLNKNINIIRFEEASNFIPIEILYFNYFDAKEKIYTNGDFMNGKLFINNTFFEKRKQKKIVIFERNKENNKYNKIIMNLEPNEDIKKVKENLKNKTIEEMLNDAELKKNITLIDMNENKKEEQKIINKEIKQKNILGKSPGGSSSSELKMDLKRKNEKDELNKKEEEIKKKEDLEKNKILLLLQENNILIKK